MNKSVSVKQNINCLANIKSEHVKNEFLEEELPNSELDIYDNNNYLHIHKAEITKMNESVSVKQNINCFANIKSEHVKNEFLEEELPNSELDIYDHNNYLYNNEDMGTNINGFPSTSPTDICFNSIKCENDDPQIQIKEECILNSNFGKDDGEDGRGNYITTLNQSDISGNAFSCGICSYRTTDKADLEKHYSSFHYGENIFSCTICYYKSNKISSMKKHNMSNHIEKKTYKCDVCPYTAINKSLIRDHMFSHTGEKPYSCDCCSYRSAQRSNVYAHMRAHVLNKKLAKRKEYNKFAVNKDYSCEFCSYTSIRKSNVKMHMLLHSGENPFTCHFCSYKTAQKTSLKLHMLIHSKERIFLNFKKLKKGKPKLIGKKKKFIN